ncbi:hypothetical protein OOT46_12100 [Aquabacterium sp. A7-Y]|uniref:tetratricopeptide repeat protein n=1 Tax=Aquabacterium sp. A7-Y TaxID=1349605 RepID=UPI00223CEFAD|nr:hypothetical protein [Aquabacterium sp. A7-Y]MCW7538584.1 hypothetical protein [Aquabacterium sp. A7-Y]
MHSRFSLRPALTRLAAVAAMALAAAAPAGAADLPRVVQDPHYGDGLFYFFQDRYFTSLTTLMVSQHFERLPQHADEAEILRGGLLLSYGLHREAGRIFEQLIEKGAAPAVRDRAWFYLAKIRYQRGFVVEAQAALDRVETHLPPELDEERGLLKAYLAMARADYAGAAAALQGLPLKDGAGPYVRYNLGVALIKSGDTAGGSVWLDELGRAPATTEELRSLRDKANVALGFAALQEQRAEPARTYLERVRLSSPQANKALLGFGWAAAALDSPRLALVPWTELSQRDASDAAVLEAKIAVAYAYAELGAWGQSLQRYQEAIETFERENTALDESIAAIRAGRLVDGLMAHNPGEEMGWFWSLRELPEMPHAGHLAQVLAGHEFQEAFKNYRDLRFLENNLQDWQGKLGAFDDMLAHRRQAYAERLPKILESARHSENGQAALERRRDELAAELARVEADADAGAFGDAKQRELLARLARVRDALERAGSDPELDPARERYRLAAGVLNWQLAQDFPVRLWEAKKAFGSLGGELAEARRRGAALEQAQRDEPARFDRFGARIPELGQRIAALMPRVVALRGEQQQVVEALAAAELLRQKERLAVYTTQARFAVAQLYDHAKLKQEESHDAATK